MKKLKLGFLGIALLGTVLCQAQQEKVKKTPEQRSEHMTERLTKSLNLNDEQRNRVANLNDEFTQQIKALRDETKAIKDQLKALKDKKRVHLETYEKDMQAILTPTQFEQFKTMQAKRKEKMRKKHQERKAAHHHSEH